MSKEDIIKALRSDDLNSYTLDFYIKQGMLRLEMLIDQDIMNELFESQMQLSALSAFGMDFSDVNPEADVFLNDKLSTVMITNDPEKRAYIMPLLEQIYDAYAAAYERNFETSRS